MDFRRDRIEQARQESLAKATFNNAPEVPVEIPAAVFRSPKPGHPATAVNVTERFVFRKGTLIVYVYYDPGLGLTREEREAMKGIFG